MRTSILIIATCSLQLISCQPGDLINIPINPPRLVVSAQPNDGQPWQVFVARTVPFNDARVYPGGVPNASVKVFDGDNLIDELSTTTSEDSVSEFTGSAAGPVAGHTYSVIVEADGYEKATGSYTHPGIVEIESFEYEVVGQSGISNQGSNYQFVDTQLRLKVTFTDPPGDNFYQIGFFHVFAEGPVTVDNAEMEYITSTLVDYQSLQSSHGTIIDDKKFSGKTVTLTFETRVMTMIGEDLQWHQPNFIFSLSNLSKHLYDYRIYGLRQGPNFYDPYAEPPLVTTNIQNGLGVFAGYTSSLHFFDYMPF